MTGVERLLAAALPACNENHTNHVNTCLHRVFIQKYNGCVLLWCNDGVFAWCRAGLQMIDIQEMLGDAVNNLVKHFYKPERDVSTPASLFVLISC